MSTIRLATRYAKSLLDTASEVGKLTEVFDDMTGIKEAFSSSEQLRGVMKSPVIDKNKKHDILNALFSGKISGTSLTYLNNVIDKGREAYLPEIANAFIDQYNTSKAVISADIISASDVSSDLENQVIDIIKNKTGAKTVHLNSTVDESLIGGFILKYNDRLYDTSISGRLAKLRNEFKDNKYIKKL